MAGSIPTELGTKPVNQLIRQYAVPGIIAMTASSLYNMVDSIYIGRRMSDGQVFDTTIADTAKFYHIYDASKSYAPVSVSWAEEATSIKLSDNSVVNGFAYGLKAMHPDEKASFLFGYNLGYSSSGSGNLIPPYAALRFDVEMVPAP